MKISQLKIGATINTGAYSNIQPEVTVDIHDGDDIERAKAEAMKHITGLWNKYAAEGSELKGDVAGIVERKAVKCFVTGTTAYFDPVSHTYINEKGELYTSGSVYAGSFEHEFNKHLILPKSAAKLGVDEQTVDEYWQSKGDVATTFGTALHQAIEHFGMYHKLAEKDGKPLGIHPTLLPIVEAFFKDRMDEDARYERFVADDRNMRCGFIDRLVITGNKRCIIEDYKTNGDLYKKGQPAFLKAPYSFLPNMPVGRYTIQLSFYKAIMEAAGWTVDGLRIHWWNGKEWETIDIKPVEIDAPQKPINLMELV